MHHRKNLHVRTYYPDQQKETTDKAVPIGTLKLDSLGREAEYTKTNKRKSPDADRSSGLPTKLTGKRALIVGRRKKQEKSKLLPACQYSGCICYILSK